MAGHPQAYDQNEKAKEGPQRSVQHAAENVWSTMIHKVIQQEARSKKFEEVWPHIVDKLILKGFSGVY